jgi:hypothetical protein
LITFSKSALWRIRRQLPQYFFLVPHRESPADTPLAGWLLRALHFFV